MKRGCREAELSQTLSNTFRVTCGEFDDVTRLIFCIAGVTLSKTAAELRPDGRKTPEGDGSCVVASASKTLVVSLNLCCGLRQRIPDGGK